RDAPEHARADPLRDRLDRASLSRAVPSLEHDADLEPLVPDPLLEPHQLDVELLQLLLVLLALHSSDFAALARGFGLGGSAVAARPVLSHVALLSCRVVSRRLLKRKGYACMTGVARFQSARGPHCAMRMPRSCSPSVLLPRAPAGSLFSREARGVPPLQPPRAV